MAHKYDVKMLRIGTIISEPTIILEGLKENGLELDVNILKNLYNSSIETIMEK